MAKGDITRLLDGANAGDPEALTRIIPLLHDELRHIARMQLAHEAEGHTLETSNLVSEAFLRLVGLNQITWRDRQHVLAMASRAMRRVLIDYAERRKAGKRGGGSSHADLHDSIGLANDPDTRLLELNEALTRLERIAPRQSRVVECRFFGGLSVDETASALQLSPATVKREWTAARAWLNRELAN